MHASHLHLPRPFVLALVLSLALFAFGGATVAGAQGSTAQRGVVAANALGRATSTFRGTTLDGRAVTGKFVPRVVTRKDGRLRYTGTLRGTIAGKAGSAPRHFTKTVTDRIKRINGLTWKQALAGRNGMRADRALATCGILNLVLGPLDLDILGLKVHLDRVVLNIVAQSGAGNLLGNLLCAVAGLLDGGLSGLLSQVRALLNLVLGALNLGPLPVG
jgi:hypothetical protein